MTIRGRMALAERRGGPEGPGDGETPGDLRRLRDEIDHLDQSLIELIEARLRLATEAAAVKGMLGMDLRDVRREAEVARRASVLARRRGMDPEIVRDIFWRLIALSHRTAGPVPAHQERTS